MYPCYRFLAITSKREYSAINRIRLALRDGLRVMPIILLLPLCLFATVRAASAPKSVAVIDSVLAGSVQLQGKVVYLDFWASWCVPCRQSFPWMATLKQKYDSLGLQIVTVNLDKDHAAAAKFLDELKSPLKVVYDSTGSLAKSYNLEAMPTSFVYDRMGKLRSINRGFAPKEAAVTDSLIRSLLEEGRKK